MKRTAKGITIAAKISCRHPSHLYINHYIEGVRYEAEEEGIMGL